MTGPLPRGVISYRRGDNTVLRYALFELWRSRCHVCEEPQLFVNTHIDHIIPESTSAEQLCELIAQHGLPADFHLHRPANLALICSKDNTRKGSRLLPMTSRAMTNLLATAREYEAEVERRVRERTSANAVAKGLVRATETNLHRPKNRDAFLRHAPAVVQALALLDEDRAARYTAVRHLHLPTDDQYVRVNLDARGRAALPVIEDICGSSLEAVLQAGIPHLKTAIGKRVAAHVRAGHHQARDLVITTDPFVATIHRIDFHRHGTTISVAMTGRAIGEAHAAASGTDPPGAALQLATQDRYVDVQITFALNLRWDLGAAAASPAAVSVDLPDVTLVEFEVWKEPLPGNTSITSTAHEGTQ